VLSSAPRGTGDSGEYVAAAANLAAFERPSLTAEERARVKIDVPKLTGADGRQDTLHFWMYPLFAALPLRAATAIGLDPAWAFAAVNLVLLAAAAAIAATRLDWPALAVVFASPILWWIDKIHTEVFTFSLLVIAFTLLPRLPGAALAAIGVAATQNPPLVAVLAIAAAASWMAAPARRRHAAAGAAAGIAIAALHPIYYWIRLGRAAPLADAAAPGIPTLKGYGAVLWDLNIGLVTNYPWIAVAVLIAIGMARSRPERRPHAAYRLAAVLSAVWLLFVFSQMINMNHGGTPGMSRYALWLIPLAIPFLDRDGAPDARTWLRVTVAAAAAAWSVWLFRPAAPEHYLEPSAAAKYVWTRYPALDNPVPEIFVERMRHAELFRLTAATPDCSKVLLWHGEWPAVCPARPTPDWCAPGSCYANRGRDGEYRFTAVARFLNRTW
jgi:hypothetical protein